MINPPDHHNPLLYYKSCDRGSVDPYKSSHDQFVGVYTEDGVVTQVVTQTGGAVAIGRGYASGREGWNSIILPLVTLAWGGFLAGSLRLMRSAMLDVLDSEYVKLAKAKGVSTRSLIWKHAFRNALIPPLTLAGVSMPAILTGSITTELVFAWPGMGQLAIQALYTSDYPLLQGLTIMFTLGYVGIALAVDILYAYIDPRIRFA